jgi:hypothetical protein
MSDDFLSRIEYDPEALDVESIMRQVRAHLGEQAGRPARSAVGQRPGDTVTLDGLRQAEARVAALQMAPQVAPSAAPVLGRALDRVRLEFHRLVVFYVSRLVDAQSRFNRETVTAMEGLADTGADARISALEARVADLEARLSALDDEKPAKAETERGST